MVAFMKLQPAYLGGFNYFSKLLNVFKFHISPHVEHERKCFSLTGKSALSPKAMH